MFDRGGPSDPPAVSVAEAAQRQAMGALVVDVREPDEWAQGHVPGAQLLPLGRLATATALPRDRELLIICRSGNRSGRAVAALRGAGYDRAVNVTGGMIAWVASGLPVARG